MKVIIGAVALAVAFMGTASSVEGAAYCRAPPGQGAVDQYCELIPAAGGSVPADALRKGALDLSALDRTLLTAAGADGAAVINFAETSTAPSAAKRSATSAAATPAVGSDGLIVAAKTSLAGTVLATDWLPWLLLLVTGAALGAAWMRSRRTRE